MVTFNTDKHLYHGTNSFVLIRFLNETTTDESDFIVTFVDKWELSKNVDVNSRSQIGMNGEPFIVYPRGASYRGVVKKYTNDNLNKLGRTGIDDFTTSIMKLDGYGNNAEGLLNLFDLTFISINPNGERLTSKAFRCVLSNIKRGIKKDGFMMDEISFDFHRFDQQVQRVYDLTDDGLNLGNIR